MTAELTVDLNEPYYGGSGSASAAVSVAPWMIAVDGRRYLLDTESEKYGRESIDVLQQRNTTNQRDTLLLPQDVWRQQAESWHQGAGQTNLDRDDALQYRFSRSFGIDPWTKYELRLLNETTEIVPLTGANPSFVQVHGGKLAVITGTTITFVDTDLTLETPLTVGTTTIIGITYDGDGIYTLHEDGKVFFTTNETTTVERTVTAPTGTTPTANPKSSATFIAYVKDYLVLGVGNQLWDITDTAVGKMVYVSPVTGFTWKGAAEGNQAIYAVGGSGDKHVIHRIGVKSDGTGLQPAVTAGTLPDGEIAVSIGSYLGYVFVGTDKGVRMAAASASADLVLGALIPTTEPVYGFEGQDRFVWTTASAVNPVPSHGETADFKAPTLCGLLRVDMSIFTVTELTPAYAYDLVSTETGKVVRSVTTWMNKRVFSVDGGGVYLETANKVKAGWLENGRVSFSVEDLKTALYAQAKWEPLRGTVAIDISYDSSQPLRVANWAVRDSIRSGNISLNGAQFSRVDVTYTLYRDATTPTDGPTFTRFEFRARAVKGAASRWSLPIINHEQLDLNGIIEARDVTDEFFKLMSLVESGKMFPLQEWGRTYYVTAKDFVWKPERLNLAGDGWEGVYTLIVEEVR